MWVKCNAVQMIVNTNLRLLDDAAASDVLSTARLDDERYGQWGKAAGAEPRTLDMQVGKLKKLRSTCRTNNVTQCVDVDVRILTPQGTAGERDETATQSLSQGEALVHKTYGWLLCSRCLGYRSR